MPIEIMELVVRGSVNSTGENSQTGSEMMSNNIDNASRQQLIQDCIDQVLEILRERQER